MIFCGISSILVRSRFVGWSRFVVFILMGLMFRSMVVLPIVLAVSVFVAPFYLENKNEYENLEVFYG